MSFFAAFIALCQVTQAADAPAPLNNDQIAQIARLLRETEHRNAELKIELEDLQARLTDAYASYELDEERITSLQKQITATQHELLLNYHRLQIGFRKIVGPERFPKIKARLDRHLKKSAEHRQQATEPTSP